MKITKLKVFIFLIVLIVAYQQIWRSIGRDTYVDIISKYVPKSVKTSIQGFFFKNKLQNIEIEKLKEENKKIKEELLVKYNRDKLALKFKLKEPIRINYVEDNEFNIFNEKFSI